VVCARVVYHLKDEWLLEEVVLLVECDVHVDMSVVTPGFKDKTRHTPYVK
jgi:hypothetical protein